jgi:hypothetical protein
MMVAIDAAGSEVYVPIELDILDGVLPRNNSRDIMRVVSICNAADGISYDGVTSEPVEFVDMYGLLANDRLEMWENLNDTP